MDIAPARPASIVSWCLENNQNRDRDDQHGDRNCPFHQERKWHANLSEDYEVRYWTKELGVTEDRLRELVRQHGNSINKIREALRTAA